MRVWREVAQMGGGIYIPIPQDGGKLVVIETPFDVEIIELQEKLNGTVIPYGPRHKRSGVEQKTRQVTGVAAAAPSAAADMAGYLNKRAQGEARRSHHRRRRSGRRVSAPAVRRYRRSRTTNFRMRCAPCRRPQRQEMVTKQATERKALNDRMTDLVRKRDTFIADQQKKQPVHTADSFDRAVQSTLKAQIKR